MAIPSVCGTLKSGADYSCAAPQRKYAQQISVINTSDIDRSTIVITAPVGATPTVCAYNVAFDLLAGKKGFHFTGSENGSTYKGYVDTTTSETFGTPDFKHNVQMMVAGVTEEDKCRLDALIRGKFVVALQFADGTIEIYGIQNGLSMVDGTYDIQDGGGGAVMVLSSKDDAPEGFLPLVYKSGTPGSEIADFDADFENEA